MTDDLTPSDSAVLVLDEAENLIWALLDDRLEEADAEKLAKLLEEHELVRRRYIACVQLHVDLQDHFAAVGSTNAIGNAPAIPPDLTRGIVPGADAPLNQ